MFESIKCCLALSEITLHKNKESVA